ncbi:recombinase family protein [Rhizobium sp. Rhizsp82]|uniref:recombinase family protein n=1 Tax=Rhizobium sp. Rhizsp82 TaxID=3243057 RepID=UPI0039B47D75
MDHSPIKQADHAGKLSSNAGLAAAAYLRMSTDLQVNSTDNQMDVIAGYAQRCGFSIVKVYRDEGKSGLRLAGRPALRQLLCDASSGRAGFCAVLVCDISRWGRFQDPDEAAEMEMRCRRAGICVHYCAEPFDNDGSLSSSILKTVKRAMAGEYSRELSAKVWRGQAALVRQGYHQGGRPGYGLRRLLVDANGRPKSTLARGELKSIATDRVVLVPGPDNEIAVVTRIFTLFAEKEISTGAIASILDGDGISTDTGTRWSAAVIERILTNEKYIGNSVWGRTSSTLRQPRRARSLPDWVRCDGAFDAIVTRALFEKAQARLAERTLESSDDAMLAHLETVLRRAGKLTAGTINAYGSGPSSAAYIYRFGSLRAAYLRIGYQTDRDYRFVREREAARPLEIRLRGDLAARLNDAGHETVFDGRIIRVDHNWSVLASVLCCHKNPRHRELQWRVSAQTRTKADFYLGARLDSANRSIIDYFVFPFEVYGFTRLILTPRNERSIEAYRLKTLDDFVRMTKSVSTEAVA